MCIDNPNQPQFLQNVQEAKANARVVPLGSKGRAALHAQREHLRLLNQKNEKLKSKVRIFTDNIFCFCLKLRTPYLLLNLFVAGRSIISESCTRSSCNG